MAGQLDFAIDTPRKGGLPSHAAHTGIAFRLAECSRKGGPDDNRSTSSGPDQEDRWHQHGAAAGSRGTGGHRGYPALADCVTAGCPSPVPLPSGAFRFPQGARWQYQLQAARDASGTACLYPSTGGINTGITGTSFATGAAVAPTVSIRPGVPLPVIR